MTLANFDVLDSPKHNWNWMDALSGQPSGDNIFDGSGSKQAL